MLLITSALLSCASLAAAWMPDDRPESLHAFNITSRSASTRLDKKWLYGGGNTKLRGVNLGSQFISEPWMLSDVWTNTMGCGSSCSEFDCVSKLGQSKANSVFQNHWANWITTTDIQKMHDVGLNTIRMPLGYWIKEDLVDSSEHFPQGALPYLDALVGKASDLGMYIILDFHGAPYGQKNDAFTGQCNPNPGFYQTSQYTRAYSWLTWMTNRIHQSGGQSNPYRNVGMIEILNEPLSFGNQIQSEKDTMVQQYYPGAIKAVRDAENSLGIMANNKLHVQMMDNLWGAGNPKQNLPSDASLAYDDHEYINGANPGTTKAAYLNYACHDDRTTDGDTPKVVGEFSLAINQGHERDSEFSPANYKDWYSQYFSAQIQQYEKTLGWVFWSWKVQWSGGGDYRWDYQAAMSNGVIPSSSSGLDSAVKRAVC